MRFFAVLFVLIVVVFVPARPAPAQEAPAAAESAYERVIRTGTLRCGYILIPPELSRNPNTGEMSGLMADLMKEIGRRLNLRIEWTAEVGFADMAAGLQARRYDAVCFSLYRLAGMARSMAFSTPLFYSRTSIYVRADDRRFDSDPMSLINTSGVRIATVDGEMAEMIAREDFPRATPVSLPQLTDLSQMLLLVASGKADVALVNSVVAGGFLAANPGKLRPLPLPVPLRVFSHGLAYGNGESALGRMLDTAIDEINDQGVLARLLAGHEGVPGSYLRVAPPYLVSLEEKP